MEEVRVFRLCTKSKFGMTESIANVDISWVGEVNQSSAVSVDGSLVLKSARTPLFSLDLICLFLSSAFDI